MFLKRVHELLLGEHGFYDDVFHAPRRAVRGGQVATRRQPDRPRRGDARTSRCRSPRSSACTASAATSSPTSTRCAGKSRHMPRRARPGHVRPHDLGPRPRVPHRRRRRRREDDARRPARRAARRVLPHDRHRVHAHPGHRRAALDPVQGRGRAAGARPRTQKHRILERLNAAEAFEKFLATKYVGTKRFGLEGAESAIPILDEILSDGRRRRARLGVVLGMAHRGRLNVLVQHHRQELRRRSSASSRATSTRTSVQGSGDVKYHLGATGKYVSPSGADITVELAANPSHLETVDPIVLGMVRARAGPDRAARLVSRCCRS